MSSDAPDRLKEFESLKEIESLKGIERLANRARQREVETQLDVKALKYWESFFKQELEKKKTEWDELDEERQTLYTGTESDDLRRREIDRLQQEIQRKHGELEPVLRKLDETERLLSLGYASPKVIALWYDIYYDFKDEYSDE